MTNPTMDLLWGLPKGSMAYPTGSRVICDPPVLDTDEDYVVWGHPDGYHRLVELGFTPSSTSYYSDLAGFKALRKGNVNIIFTHEREFYHDFVRATRLAKALNLRDKAQRITLFQAILYENYPQ